LKKSPNNICFFFNDTATTEIYTRSIVGSVPVARVAQPKPAEPPPMADERFADPLEPESHVAAYILLLLTMLALVAVVARAEGWL